MLFTRGVPKILNRKVGSTGIKEHSQALLGRELGPSSHSEHNSFGNRKGAASTRWPGIYSRATRWHSELAWLQTKQSTPKLHIDFWKSHGYQLTWAYYVHVTLLKTSWFIKVLSSLPVYWREAFPAGGGFRPGPCLRLFWALLHPHWVHTSSGGLCITHQCEGWCAFIKGPQPHPQMCLGSSAWRLLWLQVNEEPCHTSEHRPVTACSQNRCAWTHAALSWPDNGADTPCPHPPLMLFKELLPCWGCGTACSLCPCPHPEVLSELGAWVMSSASCNFLWPTISGPLYINPRKGLRPIPKFKNRPCCKRWRLYFSPRARTSG